MSSKIAKPDCVFKENGKVCGKKSFEDYLCAQHYKKALPNKHYCYYPINDEDICNKGIFGTSLWCQKHKKKVDKKVIELNKKSRNLSFSDYFFKIDVFNLTVFPPEELVPEDRKEEFPEQDAYFYYVYKPDRIFCQWKNEKVRVFETSHILKLYERWGRLYQTELYVELSFETNKNCIRLVKD